MSFRKVAIGVAIAAIVADLGLLGYVRYLAPLPEVPTPTPNPASARLVTVVSAEGVIVPAREARLAFEMGGRVAELTVSEGDVVVSGQVLARLDDTDLHHAVAQAEAALAVAQAQLAAAQAGARAEEVAVAEAGLIAAQAQLAQVKVGARDEEISITEEGVAVARAQLAQVRAGVRPEEIDAAREAVAAAQAQLAAAQAQLSAVQADAQRAQAELDRALSAEAKLLAGPTQRELDLARIAVEAARDQVYAVQAQRDSIGGLKERGMATAADHEAAKAAVLQAEDAVRSAEVQYEQLRDGPRDEDKAMAAAAVSAAQAAKAATEAQVAALQSQVNAAQAAVSQAEHQLRALEAGPTGEQVAVAEVQVGQAQAQVDLLRAGATGEAIAIAQAAVDQAQAQLNLVQAGARSEDLAVIEAQIHQAAATLARARASLDNVLLTAPFDGTIASVNTEVGEIVVPGTPLIVLGGDSHLQVETEDLSEVDVSLLRIGQAAEVTVDALPDVKFQGQITRIAPLATTHRGDKVYKVTLDLEEGIEAGLRWGMTAFVDITVR